MAKKRQPKRPKPRVARPTTPEEREWYERELGQMRLPLPEFTDDPPARPDPPKAPGRL